MTIFLWRVEWVLRVIFLSAGGWLWTTDNAENWGQGGLPSRVRDAGVSPTMAQRIVQSVITEALCRAGPPRSRLLRAVNPYGCWLGLSRRLKGP